MTMQELVAQANQEITYPGETLLEKYAPAIDHVIDYVMVGVFVVENVFRGQEQAGPDKSELLVTLLSWLWDIVPIKNEAFRTFFGPIFKFSMPALINKLVDWLNGKLPEGQRDLTALVPAATFEAQDLGMDWLKKAFG